MVEKKCFNATGVLTHRKHLFYNNFLFDYFIDASRQGFQLSSLTFVTNSLGKFEEHVEV